MQRFLSFTLALCIGLTLSFDADARRLGGGKSFGNAPKHQPLQRQQQQRQQQRQQSDTQHPANKAATAPSKVPGFLGPLAGLMAGGILASLLFGDAFQGLQLFDILILAALAFLLFRFIGARRAPKAQPQLAGANAAPMQREAEHSLFTAQNNTQKPVMQAPDWFDETSFLTAAREYFNRLQQHWDANEMDAIAEFFTPEMMAFLKKERANLGDGYQATYIDNLEVHLDGIETLDDYCLATLTFSGITKTSRFDQGEAFSESWRMERKNGENQPWLIAGIRQNA